ncbi:hypothetical protein [Mycolicibacterium agri]|nr:hypothetical protein [Mycolicibacterium agri]
MTIDPMEAQNALTNATADDFGEWLRLAREAFTAVAADGRTEFQPPRWR